ncbi:RagB/SusD family nutrient uptake outer membrane protein [uncultured Algoriphagus sp.]|uniref:RagB/SusD family nutrient uptake outer membrane protein n=1 Tax=uncultured Algoriphagus sp. TaxID=417365 RepID=UPI00258532FD|nr:RagB/SusD family nutrient uptake outer membrane protein [uncultured Algoriphagus sp.]
MKIRNILILSAAISLGSCSESFLEINSETDLTTGNYFQTEGDLTAAVNGIYAALPGIYNNAWMLGEFASDNTYYALNISRGDVEEEEQIANHQTLRANPNTAEKFSANYILIARANQVIVSLESGSFDPSFANPLRGEALFLRALAYFDLVQYFGAIPLFTEPVESFEDTRQPLAEPSEVYSLIISDLNEAGNLLPGKSSQLPGRATSEAAYTLLGNVHVVREEWSLAEAALNNVINALGLGLEENYANAFSPSNKNGRESIFEVQYLEGPLGFASAFTYPWLPVPLSASTYGALLGVSDPQEDNNRQTFNMPTKEFIDSFEDGDVRLDYSVDYVQLEPSANYPENPPVHPFISKFLHPHANFGQAGDNWPVYRYAEAKLLMAEALFEQNSGSTVALAHVNDVRARAGLEPLTSLTKDAILNERRHELAFENKRYLDLKRTGRLVPVMTAMGEAIRANPQEYYFPPGTTPPPGVLTSIITEYEIPTAEAALNPNID